MRSTYLGFSLLVVTACSSATGADPITSPAEAEDREQPNDRTGQPGTSSGAPSTSTPAPTTPPQAPTITRRQGVVFLHGTSDQGTEQDLACEGTGEAYSCIVPHAIDDYWPRETVDAERARDEQHLRPFAVLGCPLASHTPWPNSTPVHGGGPEPGSATCVAAEISRFLAGPDGVPGNGDDIEDVAIVTHSGGINVARYILQQHTASADFARVHDAARVIVAIAGPARGTYLANLALKKSGLLSFGVDAMRRLGGSNYDDDGTAFIRTFAMDEYNKDPAKLVDLAKDVAGVPVLVASGASVDLSDSAKASCGGGADTAELRLLHQTYLDTIDPATYRDGCSDGFVTCQSAMALANGDPERVIFGRLEGGHVIGETHYRAHHQSRQSCNGAEVDIGAAINKWLDAASAKLQEQVQAGGAGKSAAIARLASAEMIRTAIPTLRPHEPLDLAPAARLATGARTHLGSAHATAAAGEVEVVLDVQVTRAERLGARAELVATDDAGRAWTVAVGQVGGDLAPGAQRVSMRLPTAGAPAGARLSVRNVALVSHVTAETLDVLAPIGVASP